MSLSGKVQLCAEAPSGERESARASERASKRERERGRASERASERERERARDFEWSGGSFGRCVPCGMVFVFGYVFSKRVYSARSFEFESCLTL